MKRQLQLRTGFVDAAQTLDSKVPLQCDENCMSRRVSATKIQAAFRGMAAREELVGGSHGNLRPWRRSAGSGETASDTDQEKELRAWLKTKVLKMNAESAKIRETEGGRKTQSLERLEEERADKVLQPSPIENDIHSWGADEILILLGAFQDKAFEEIESSTAELQAELSAAHRIVEELRVENRELRHGLSAPGARDATIPFKQEIASRKCFIEELMRENTQLKMSLETDVELATSEAHAKLNAQSLIVKDLQTEVAMMKQCVQETQERVEESNVANRGLQQECEQLREELAIAANQNHAANIPASPFARQDQHWPVSGADENDEKEKELQRLVISLQKEKEMDAARRHRDKSAKQTTRLPAHGNAKRTEIDRRSTRPLSVVQARQASPTKLASPRADTQASPRFGRAATFRGDAQDPFLLKPLL